MSLAMPSVSGNGEYWNEEEDLKHERLQASSKKQQDELDADVESQASIYANSFTRKLLQYGVEEVGVRPISEAERTDTQLYKVFTLWVAMSVGVIPLSAGILGPSQHTYFATRDLEDTGLIGRAFGSGVQLESERLVSRHHLLWSLHLRTGRLPLYSRSQNWPSTDGAGSLQLWLLWSVVTCSPKLGHPGRVLRP